jgi:hypothetical protein
VEAVRTIIITCGKERERRSKAKEEFLKSNKSKQRRDRVARVMSKIRHHRMRMDGCFGSVADLFHPFFFFYYSTTALYCSLLLPVILAA